MARPDNPPDFKRSARLNRLLKEEIGSLLRKDIRDPRIGEILITDVVVSDDIRHARVYYTGHDLTPERREEILLGLERAAGFMRGRIGKSLRLKRTPELHFAFDDSFDYGERIETLLSRIRPGEEDHGGDSGDH